jgi:RimJ/RimL family protein N-acetyltransferase
MPLPDDPRQDSAPELLGTGVRLREPRDEDAAAWRALGRDPGIARMFGVDRAAAEIPLQEADALAWLARLRSHRHAWIIEHEGRLIGEIRLHSLEPKDKAARIAIAIFDPRRLGMGLGTEAICLVLAYGFGTIGLHRIDLRVLAFNERAIRAYRKCGFAIEGRLREAALVDGERHDDLIMGLLASEFRER